MRLGPPLQPSPLGLVVAGCRRRDGEPPSSLSNPRRSSLGIVGASVSSGNGRAGGIAAVRRCRLKCEPVIRAMSEANPLWGAPGIPWRTSEAQIELRCRPWPSSCRVRRRLPPSQTWPPFLTNHVGQIMAADFFVVPTATYRLLFVLVILAHHRRARGAPSPSRPRREGVDGPTAREAFPEDKAPGVPDSRSGRRVRRTRSSPQGDDGHPGGAHRTTVPVEDPYAERLIGSLRRECCDRVIVVSEAGLRRILTEYLLVLCVQSPDTSGAGQGRAASPGPVAPSALGSMAAHRLAALATIVTTAAPRSRTLPRSARSLLCESVRIGLSSRDLNTARR